MKFAILIWQFVIGNLQFATGNWQLAIGNDEKWEPHSESDKDPLWFITIAVNKAMNFIKLYWSESYSQFSIQIWLEV